MNSPSPYSHSHQIIMTLPWICALPSNEESTSSSCSVVPSWSDPWPFLALQDPVSLNGAKTAWHTPGPALILKQILVLSCIAASLVQVILKENSINNKTHSRKGSFQDSGNSVMSEIFVLQTSLYFPVTITSSNQWLTEGSLGKTI